MARTYGLHLVRRGLGALTATFGLVLVVFLAERLTGFVEMAIQRQAPLFDLPWVLALTAPEIVVTAMPIALLIGVYRALADARDGGETVVLAGAGVGPWGLTASLLGLGLAASVVVVIVAGFVDPIARAVRDRLFLEAAHQMVVSSIRDGLQHDRIESFGGHTFLSPSFGAPDGRHLLLFLRREGDTDRVVAATGYDLTEIEGTRRYRLRLHDVTVTDLTVTPPAATAAAGSVLGGSGYRLGTLAREIDLDEPLRDPVLADMPQYRTLASLIAATVDPSRTAYGLRAAELLTRAWLSVAAVLVAAIAVSFSDGPGRFVALPVAGAGLVVADIALVRVVRGFDAASPLADAGHGAVAIVLLLAGLAVVSTWRYPAMVAPSGGRT